MGKLDDYFWKIILPSFVVLVIKLGNRYERGELMPARIANDIASTIGMPYLCKDIIYSFSPENGVVISASIVAFLSHRTADFIINVFNVDQTLNIIFDAIIETIKNWINRK